MKIVIGRDYHKYRCELATKLRYGYVDVSTRDDLEALCYFCVNPIRGQGSILVDNSAGMKKERILVPVHNRCYSSAILGEFDIHP